MNRDQAREVLATWRPTDATPDPEVAEAMDLVQTDPELKAWFEAHQRFQQAARQVLREIPVPAGMTDRILAASRVVRPGFGPPARLWVATLAAAATIVAAVIWWMSSSPSGAGDDFSVFRSRMVRATLREYRMDIETNNLAAIHEFFGSRAAPANFELTPALARLQPVGGGVLSWQGQPVSMLCLNSEELGMLYLFVVPTEAIARGAPNQPMLDSVKSLATASWTRDSRVYVLAAAASPEALQKLLEPAPG